MNTTSLDLLERLKLATPDTSEWRSLRDISLRMIHHWLSRLPKLHDEVDDLTQEVLVVLLREWPSVGRRRAGQLPNSQTLASGGGPTAGLNARFRKMPD
jgi:RNA polymerase sigma-70 factor (ECF subfamily)